MVRVSVGGERVIEASEASRPKEPGDHRLPYREPAFPKFRFLSFGVLIIKSRGTFGRRPVRPRADMNFPSSVNQHRRSTRKDDQSRIALSHVEKTNREFRGRSRTYRP